MTSKKSNISLLSHSFILHHGFELQAPEETSKKCPKLELKQSLMHLIGHVCCTCCTVFPSQYNGAALCLTLPDPPFPPQPPFLLSPQAALCLADSPEASQCILECIPLCCLHRKVLFFQMFCFIP